VATIVPELRRHLRERAAPAADLEGIVARARDELRREQGREATVAELCGRLGRSEEAVLCALDAGRARRCGERTAIGASRRAA
jgi:DNA-directed RNA polymerase specialized sigma subunit